MSIHVSQVICRSTWRRRRRRFLALKPRTYTYSRPINQQQHSSCMVWSVCARTVLYRQFAAIITSVVYRPPPQQVFFDELVDRRDQGVRRARLLTASQCDTPSLHAARQRATTSWKPTSLVCRRLHGGRVLRSIFSVWLTTSPKYD